MSTRESYTPIVAGALLGIFVTFARGDYLARDASASAGTAASMAKSPPRTLPPNVRSVTSKCVLDAYAKLEAEAVALRAKHGADHAGYKLAYAKRKDEIVGKNALKNAGCAKPTLEAR